MALAEIDHVIAERGPLKGLPLPLGEQSPPELQWLLGKLEGIGSVLEIGSRGGKNLRCLAAACREGARIRSIELVDNAELRGTIESLREHGYDAEVFFQNSQSPRAWQWAHDQGPFDFVFIDGDHGYYATLADWMMYGTLGAVVGFHDIYHPHGPSQLWQEIKAAQYRTDEVHEGYDHMGIGIVYMWVKV